ncbi:hypothetical protein B0H19DRAFT_1041959, partial [Mycena capillaripes]
MHTVVDIIPLLLHASLVFFFCGLIAFLVPVHALMTAIAGTILFVVTAVYGVFTLLPLCYLDCPYRTPLSAAFWRILRALKRIWACRYEPVTKDSESFGSDTPTDPDETMMEAMARTAIGPSTSRSERDQKALVWTVKSLSDSVELEPFAEAIPDLLWGPNGRRHSYVEHILRLVHHPDVQLHTRIGTLLESCNTGVLSSKDSERRRIICHKALWTIASLVKPTVRNLSHFSGTTPCLTAKSSNSYAAAVDFWMIYDRLYAEPAPVASDPVTPFFISASTMIEWSTFCAVRGHLLDLRKYLELQANNSTLDLSSVISSMVDICRKFPFFLDPTLTDLNPVLLEIGREFLFFLVNPAPTNIPKIQDLRKGIDFLLIQLPSNILVRYVCKAANLPSLPYRWHETWSDIYNDLHFNCPLSMRQLQDCLSRIMSTHIRNVDTLTTPPDSTNTAVIREIISVLLSLWRPTETTYIPFVIINVLNRWNPQPALRDILSAGGGIEFYLWAHFPKSLSGYTYRQGIPRDYLTALWRLASLSPNPNPVHCPSHFQLAAALDALPNKSRITISIVPLLKLRIISAQSVPDNGTIGEALA